jgi:tetratricopeptide (TPR) repeat protein
MRWIRVLLIVLAAAGLASLAACKSAHLSGGKLHFDQGRYERALEQFEMAVAEQPENGEAHLWLGRALAELDQPEKAAAEFDKALELDSLLTEQVENTRGHYWVAWYNLGLLTKKQGEAAKEAGDEAASAENFEKAVGEFRKAIVYDPANEKAHTNIGEVLYKLGRTDEAVEMFKTVQAMAEERIGKASDAEAATKIRDDMNEVLAAVYWNLADQAYQGEQWDAALTFYNQALALKPEETNLSYQLASTYFQKSITAEGEDKARYLESAIEHYNRVLELVKGDEDALYNMTVSLWELGQYENAEVKAKELVDVNPKDGEYHIFLARTYSKLEKNDMFVNYFVIGTALKTGTQVPVATAREEAQKHGPGTDILQALRNLGEPQEIRRFDDNTGQEYVSWFYWSQGKAIAFVKGAKQAEVDFKPVVES